MEDDRKDKDLLGMRCIDLNNIIILILKQLAA